MHTKLIPTILFATAAVAIAVAGAFAAPAAFAQSTIGTDPETKERDYPWAEERWGGTPIKMRALPLEQVRSMGFAVSTNWPTLNKTIERLNVLLNSRDFELLDRAFSELNRSPRCDNGEWVSSLPTRLNWFPRSPSEAPPAIVDEWKRARPQSQYAPYIETLVHYRTAWNARTGGYASSLTQDRLTAFGTHLASARRVAETHKATVDANPIFYLLYLGIRSVDGTSEKELLEVFDVARAKWPSYVPLYTTTSVRLLSKWGGSDAAFRDFARKNSKYAFPDSPPTALARLYSSFTDKSAHEVAGTHWAEVGKSFDDWIAASSGSERRTAVLSLKKVACNSNARDAIVRAYDLLIAENLQSAMDGDVCFASAVPVGKR